MLKLVIFAKMIVAKTALKDASSVFPHSSIALDADGVGQSAGAGVRGQTFATVTHPGLAEITDGSHHGHARGVLTGVLNHAVTSLEHAFDLAAFRTLWQPLNRLTEIAESTVFLLPQALVALHGRIRR